MTNEYDDAIHKEESLEIKCPWLFLESLNEDDSMPVYEIDINSNKKNKWRCLFCGYIWFESVRNRYLHECSCPACTGHIITETNNLAVTHPELIQEFHPTKNVKIRINLITANYGKNVWWKCQKCNHSWQATVAEKIKGKGCLLCYLRFLKKSKKNKGI